MYDIKKLEEEWERYHRKKRGVLYLKIALILISIALLYLLFSLFYPRLKSPLGKIERQKGVLVSNMKPYGHTQHKILLNKSICEIEKNTEHVNDDMPVEEIVEIPILDDTLDTKEQDYHAAKKSSFVSLPAKVSSQEEKTRQKRPKKMALKIIQTFGSDAYREVKRRFRQSHDVNDALFLAEVYYKKGKYEEAEYWALQTNKIDNTIERSWIIFAKSKFKQGHKNEAIRVLETYLKKSNSEAAAELLRKLKS